MECIFLSTDSVNVSCVNMLKNRIYKYLVGQDTQRVGHVGTWTVNMPRVS